ncbi:PfkB family carbohydrate kinase [Sulfurivermis fontis]|jgi:ketohexokinase|uniref:PfkB family carbohydrate kinase n=1 Tax=Sulfurivermis fontis TaxID=1972068 RepID=UPI000FDB9E35|nr:PfkB family carbohydrate kinase [Sulfurivermis fontis]
MARILAVGIATLDIINLVEDYPPEDAEVRALEQETRRGGNATNTLVVLSQFGHQCSWAGTLADEPDARLIRADLARHAIDTSAVEWLPRGKVPTSYITLSQRSGSRTIVHYRDLPEYSFEHFRAIDLTRFDWIHFEGRNVEVTQRMLERVTKLHPELPCSLEVEKPRPGIEQLFPYPDLLLFSRVYARACGFQRAEGLFDRVRAQAPTAQLVCAWGEGGAYARDRDGRGYHTPAFPPPRLVDTLAAGDVFNAGIIHGLARKRPLELTLIEAARLAGRKCGQQGIEGLAD